MKKKFNIALALAFALCAFGTAAWADGPGGGGHGNTGNSPDLLPTEIIKLSEGHGSNGRAMPHNASPDRSGGGGGPKSEKMSTGSGGPKKS